MSDGWNIEARFGDLEGEARALAELYPPPFVFSVVSWGCAATAWLAHALNSHPDIFCVHAANTFWANLGGAPSLDGLRYMRVLACQSSSAIASGDVHGVSLHLIPELRSQLGESFNCAIVIREPVARLRSQLAHFDRVGHIRAWNVEYIQSYLDQGIRMPEDNYRNRLSLHGINMLNSIVREVELAAVWRCEDLTSDPSALCRFVSELTMQKVFADLDWARRAVRRPAVNRHLQGTHPVKPFHDWELEAIRRIVEPKAWELYQSLGYALPHFL